MRRAATTLLTASVVMAISTGCGDDTGAGSSDPARQYSVDLRAEERGDEYAFVAEQALDLQVGDRVSFEVRNAGALAHDMQVLAPDGTVIATGAAVGPGQTLELTVDFAQPGYYRLNCNVDDHLTRHDMQAIVEVIKAD